MNKLRDLIAKPLEIYAKGINGLKPIVPIDPEKLKKGALRKLNKNKKSYLEGNAGVGRSYQANLEAFQQYRIIPKVGELTDDLKTEKSFLGFSMPVPIMICPIGALGNYHKDAEAAVARAASNLSIPMILSQLSTTSLEKIATIMQATPKIMQLYLTKSAEINESMIHRATQSGFSALVITMDTKMAGWRPGDLSRAYTPYIIDGIGLGQFYSDPVFQKLIVNSEPQISKKNYKPKLNYALLQSIYRIAKNHPEGFFKSLTSGKVKTY